MVQLQFFAIQAGIAAGFWMARMAAWPNAFVLVRRYR
jgi:hypothetical protein